MADKTLTAAEAEDAFRDSLKKSNTGMLGLDQPGYHAQPMTAFLDEDTGAIWFFTREDTDLARDAAVGSGQSAMFHYGSKDQNVWACIHGQLSGHGADREIIDRYWNPVLAAVVALAVFAGWRGARPSQPHLGIRMVPWRFVMILAAAANSTPRVIFSSMAARWRLGSSDAISCTVVNHLRPVNHVRST